MWKTRKANDDGGRMLRRRDCGGQGPFHNHQHPYKPWTSTQWSAKLLWKKRRADHHLTDWDMESSSFDYHFSHLSPTDCGPSRKISSTSNTSSTSSASSTASDTRALLRSSYRLQVRNNYRVIKMQRYFKIPLMSYFLETRNENYEYSNSEYHLSMTAIKCRVLHFSEGSSNVKKCSENNSIEFSLNIFHLVRTLVR